MRKHWLLIGILALVGSLCLADSAQAQRGRRGGRGGSYSGGGYYGNSYGNGYYGNGYYGNRYGTGYGNGYYGNQNWSNDWNDGYSRSFYPPNSYDDGDQFNQGNRQGDLRGDQRDTGENQAHITVRVPAPDTQVWFDDHRTQQGGIQRFFDSPPLESGTYSYTIRAKWRQNGRDREQTRTVRIQAGQQVTVDFARANTGPQGEQVVPPRRSSDQPNRPQRNQTDQNRQNDRDPDQQRDNSTPPRQ
jgi:uncharacterized protein (TIGR03000 family)